MVVLSCMIEEEAYWMRVRHDSCATQNVMMNATESMKKMTKMIERKTKRGYCCYGGLMMEVVGCEG